MLTAECPDGVRSAPEHEPDDGDDDGKDDERNIGAEHPELAAPYVRDASADLKHGEPDRSDGRK